LRQFKQENEEDGKLSFVEEYQLYVEGMIKLQIYHFAAVIK
jgi:hypothetical protein